MKEGLWDFFERHCPLAPPQPHGAEG